MKKFIDIALVALLGNIEALTGRKFFASACGGIDLGADYDCLQPLVPGVKQRLLLFNLDDLSVVTYSLAPTTLIEDITLKSTKAAFAFEGVKRSLNPQYAFIPQTVSVGYDHQVDFLIFDISQEQKDNIEKMGLSKLVAVVENNNSVGNGNSIFEVYGLGVGMELITAVRIPGDLETTGAFSLSLKTSDNEGKEPKMPQSWFDTDYTTTKALVDALLTPAP
jgi:hypothetical protein